MESAIAFITPAASESIMRWRRKVQDIFCRISKHFGFKKVPDPFKPHLPVVDRGKDMT